MPNLKQAIIDSVIYPYALGSFDTLLATVVNYDNINNRATVTFQDPKGPGQIQLENVPVQIGSGGIHSAGPFAGDHVWISFQNKSPLHPKIVSLADEQYQRRTRERTKHNRKGALLPDIICARDEVEPNLALNSSTAAVEDWFDLKNEDASKYAEYQDIDPIGFLETQVANLGYYGVEEPGITHPTNSSTVKLRDNGIIDIFAGTNQGLRIDPETKSFNVIANTLKQHVSDYKVFADENVSIATGEEVNIKGKTISFNGDQIMINGQSMTDLIASSSGGGTTVIQNVVPGGYKTVASVSEPGDLQAGDFWWKVVE